MGSKIKTLLLCFLLFSCQKTKNNFCFLPIGIEQFHIKKGNHAAQPRIAAQWQRKFVNYQKWELVFGEGTDYDLGNIDQKDWNKLCGRTFGFFRRNQFAAIIGWRYNTVSNMIELTAYINDNDENIPFPNVISVEQCEVFTVELNIDFVAKTYTWDINTDGGKTEQYQYEFTHNMTESYEVSVWFGGNQEAPNDIFIYKSTI